MVLGCLAAMLFVALSLLGHYEPNRGRLDGLCGRQTLYMRESGQHTVGLQIRSAITKQSHEQLSLRF